MKTIGSILKSARKQTGLSLSELESETKIKRNFIKALEAEDWQNLPEFTVVSGFVKNIANHLNLDKQEVSAFLRRDYPPKNLEINPKPDVKFVDRFSWGPRLTFGLTIFILILLTGFYLGYQYWRFARPPMLEIYAPQEGVILEVGAAQVSGRTKKGASVRINNQPALIDENGNFESVIEVSSETNQIEIKAISRSGKETLKIVPVQVE